MANRHMHLYITFVERCQHKIQELWVSQAANEVKTHTSCLSIARYCMLYSHCEGTGTRYGIIH